MSRLTRHLIPALAAWQLTACTMLPPSASAPASRPASVEVPASEPAEGGEGGAGQSAGGSVAPQAPPPRPAAAASRTLLEQSRAEQAAGEYSRAAASLERALRIDPDDPWLWLELGQVRLAEGDRGQAEMMARRALTLADGDGALEATATRLLESIQRP
jgi:tetratricopeptide (TPR) repeat protein